MNDKPKILLVYPSCFHYPEAMERLDIKTPLLWLGSYVGQFYPVEYVDYELDIGRPNSETLIRRFQRRVKNDLAAREFDILAISCWTSLSYQASHAVARICRELYPDKAIVVGGYHPSARPDEFLTDDQLFDYVVCGEGEHALMEIAQRFAESGRPDTSEVVQGRKVTIDDFVPYNWDLVDPVIRKHASDGVACLYIFLSRGCPFRCSFCMEPLKTANWRALSPEVAVEQIWSAAEHLKIRSVGISDACFGVRREWRHEFLSRVADRQPSFWVVFETRPEYITPEDIELLSNLKAEIQFGIESGSPSMLRLMHKTRTPRKYLDAFKRVSQEMTRRGIIHRANLLFNHPGENQETLDETFALMDECLTPEHSHLIWVPHAYMHFPGCEVYRERERFENEYGARFDCGDWWRGDKDQYATSMELTPSKDLDGDRRDRWWEMLQPRLERMKEILAPEVYRFAALKYYYDWQDDHRYQHA